MSKISHNQSGGGHISINTCFGKLNYLYKVLLYNKCGWSFDFTFLFLFHAPFKLAKLCQTPPLSLSTVKDHNLPGSCLKQSHYHVYIQLWSAMSAIISLEAVVCHCRAAVWLCSYNTELFVSEFSEWQKISRVACFCPLHSQQAQLTQPANCCEGYTLGVSCMLAVSIDSLTNVSSSFLIIKFNLNWFLQTPEVYLCSTILHENFGCFPKCFETQPHDKRKCLTVVA